MAIYVPTIQTPYMLRAMFENKTWAAMVASGFIDFGVLDNYVRTGEYVNIPKFNLMGDFVHGDITSGSALTFDRLSTTNDKAVILHDVSPNSYSAHDVMQSGENFGALLGTSVGEKVAKRMVGQVLRLLNGAIDGIDTPSSNCHTQDVGTGGLTIQNIRTAKYLMGDAADSLNTLIVHSKVWKDVLYDAIANYKIDVVGGQVINNGKLNGLLGIENIIVTDLCPTSGVGTGTTTDDDYSSFLVGAGAVAAAFQRQPTQEVFEDITPVSTLVKVKVGMDYCLHLRGMAWGSTANPTDSNYGNASNWNEAYEDHREVKAVKLISNGGIY